MSGELSGMVYRLYLVHNEKPHIRKLCRETVMEMMIGAHEKMHTLFPDRELTDTQVLSMCTKPRPGYHYESVLVHRSEAE